MTNPLFSDLLQKLEAERHDLSYLNPKPVERPAPVVVQKRVYRNQVEIEKYGQRMFAAGRYSAGARDKVAVAANKWLERELNL